MFTSITPPHIIMVSLSKPRQSTFNDPRQVLWPIEISLLELDFTGSTCYFFRWDLLYRGSGNFSVAAVYLADPVFHEAYI
ncbi:hypothetical protein P8452_32506 [Trifolium repens]|nr:hypothetical protein P8452_32506 [Trifolium repens]